MIAEAIRDKQGKAKAEKCQDILGQINDSKPPLDHALLNTHLLAKVQTFASKTK